MKRIDYKIENEKIVVYEKRNNKILFELPNIGRNKIRVENLKEDIDKYKELVRKRFLTKPFNSMEDYSDSLFEHAKGRIIVVLGVFYFIFMHLLLLEPTKFINTLAQFAILLSAEVAIEPIIRKWLPTRLEKEYKKDIKNSYKDLVRRSNEQSKENNLTEQKEESLKNEETKNKPTEEYTIKPTAYSENYTYDENVTNTKKR